MKTERRHHKNGRNEIGWWELGHKGVEKGLDRKEVGKKEDFQGMRGGTYRKLLERGCWVET